jgi:hypothetical protein
MGAKSIAHIVLGWKSERQSPLRRPSNTWENNIKIDVVK